MRRKPVSRLGAALESELAIALWVLHPSEAGQLHSRPLRAVGIHTGKHQPRRSPSLRYQDARIEDPGGVENSLGGIERTAEQSGALLPVPRHVIAPDCVMMGDRPA